MLYVKYDFEKKGIGNTVRFFLFFKNIYTMDDLFS